MGLSGAGYSAIQFSGCNYAELKTLVITDFQRGICFDLPGTEIWLFDSIISNNSIAGVCNLGGCSIGVSECTFEGNNYAINFFTGTTQRHSVQNTIFINNYTGISWNTAQNSYEYMAITNNIFKGNDLDITGFSWNTKADANISIETNVGLRDYRPTAYVEITGNTTPTTLTNEDEYYKLLGTNSLDSFGIKFLVTDNKAVYLPDPSRYLHLMVSGEIQVNANGQNILVAIYKNGNTVVSMQTVRCVTANIGYGFAINKEMEVNTDDYFEIWAWNDTSAGKQVILNELQFTIKS